MSTPKQAAIDVDDLQDKQLGEISAADFLKALDQGGLKVHTLTVWPEKKKVEYWTEPEDFQRIRFKDLLVIIRNEKKKVELEKMPGLEMFKQAGTEVWLDPQELLYDSLLERLVKDVEERLRG